MLWPSITTTTAAIIVQTSSSPIRLNWQASSCLSLKTLIVHQYLEGPWTYSAYLSISQDSAWCDLWQFRCLREVLLVSPSVAQCGQSKIPAASLWFRVNSTVISAVCQNCYSESVHLKPKGNQTSLIWGHPNFKNTVTYHQKVLGAKLYPAMNLQSGRRPEVIHKLQCDARCTIQSLDDWMDSLEKKNLELSMQHVQVCLRGTSSLCRCPRGNLRTCKWYANGMQMVCKWYANGPSARDKPANLWILYCMPTQILR